MYPKTAPSAVSGAESAARHMITRVEAARKSFGFIRSCDRSRDESWHWREPYLLGRAVPFLRLAGSHQKGCPSADLSLLEDLLQAHPRRPLPGQDVRSYVRKGDSLDEDHRARAVTQPQRKDLLVGGGVVPARAAARSGNETRIAWPGQEPSSTWARARGSGTGRRTVPAWHRAVQVLDDLVVQVDVGQMGDGVCGHGSTLGRVPAFWR